MLSGADTYSLLHCEAESWRLDYDAHELPPVREELKLVDKAPRDDTGESRSTHLRRALRSRPVDEQAHERTDKPPTVLPHPSQHATPRPILFQHRPPKPAPPLVLQRPPATGETGWLLCADLTHSQGAAEYALASFLTLAVRAAKELATTGWPLTIMLPISLWKPEDLRGYTVDTRSLFTRASLAALATQHGFRIYEPTEGSSEAHAAGASAAASTQAPTHHPPMMSTTPRVLTTLKQAEDQLCSRNIFDIRIGVAASSLLTPTPNITANFSTLRSTLGGLRTFYNASWDYLREMHALHKDARSHLAVCMGMHQFFPGPLAHAAAHYTEEMRSVLTTLEHEDEFSDAKLPLPVAPSVTPSAADAIADVPQRELLREEDCAYLFVSRAIRLRKQTPTNATAAAAWVLSDVTMDDIVHRAMRVVVSARLPCVVINALAEANGAPMPIDEGASALTRIFSGAAAEAAPNAPSVVREHAQGLAASPTPNAIPSTATSPRVFIARKLPQPTPSTSPTNRTAAVALSQALNRRGRTLACRAALFITMSATHWSDWPLMQRAERGLPSAILGDMRADSHRDGMAVPPPLFQCAAGETSCAHECAFHRAYCINRTIYTAVDGDVHNAIVCSAHGGPRATADMELYHGGFDQSARLHTEESMLRAQKSRARAMGLNEACEGRMSPSPVLTSGSALSLGTRFGMTATAAEAMAAAMGTAGLVADIKTPSPAAADATRDEAMTSSATQHAYLRAEVLHLREELSAEKKKVAALEAQVKHAHEHALAAAAALTARAGEESG